MVRDLKYIIKRIIIGVGIALVLMLIKGGLIANVSAMTMNASTSCVIYATSGGGTSDTCQAPPNNHTFFPSESGFGYNIWWTRPSGILIPNHTYYIKFEVSFNGFRQNGPGPSLQLYTGNDGTAGNRAYPDRNEQKSFIKQDTTQYGLVWSFHIDSSGTFNTIRITGYNDAYFGTVGGQSYTTAGIQYGIITVIDITDSSSGSNQDIINNSEANTSEIITNNTQNTTNIINNNNENTQAIIDSNTVCNIINKDTVTETGKYFYSNGRTTASANWGITDYYNLTNKEITIETNYTASTNAHTCFYNKNKELISCVNNQNISLSDFPSNAVYFRTSIQINNNKPIFKLCGNGSQSVTDSVNDLNNTINDDTGVDNSDLEDLFGDFEESNSPVSDLLTMPLTLLNAYIDGFSGTCTAFNLGNLLGTNLVLPCLNLQQKFGNDVWSLIDVLFSIYMIYNIAMLCISIYEDITGLEDGFKSLYTPRHEYTGYKPRHGGD